MPSMSEFEQLFLLEFFVDSVYIKNSSVEDVNESSLCVSFQFLNYPVMVVCEEDFGPKTKSLTKGTSVIFKSGKSCLFSLRTDQRKNMPSEFDVHVTVTQNMIKSSTSEKAFVAVATLKLGSSITDLMKKSTDFELPTAHVKQDTFPLKDKADQQVGNLAAFVRLSCFGKLIVTQFQLAGEDQKNYMFKGTDPKKIFTNEDVVKPEFSFGVQEHEEIEEEIPGDTPYKEIFGFPKESEESMKKKPEEIDDDDEEEEEEEKGEGGGGGGDHGAIAKRTIEEHEAKYEQLKEELEKGEGEENYKEIGAEINGNSICIRVLKKGKKTKKHTNKSIEEVSHNPPFSGHPEYSSFNPCNCQCLSVSQPQPIKRPQGCPSSCCPPVYPKPHCPLQSCSPNCCPTPRCPPDCCPPPSSCPVSCPSDCCPSPGCPPTRCPPPGFLPICPPSPGSGHCLRAGNLPGLNPFPGSLQLLESQIPSLNLPKCPKEDCPLGLYNLNSNPQQNPMELEPGMIAMKGDQVVFQMANRQPGEPITEKEKKLANSIYYKLGTNEQGKNCMKNIVQISAQNPGESFAGTCAYGGPVSGLPIDNKQDMFLLKVLQNNDGIDAKNELEMELRTPKTTLPKPETGTKNTQCLTTDFPAPPEKKSLDKGKKKKK